MKTHAVKWLMPVVKYGLGFGLLGLVIRKYWGPNPDTGAPGLGQLLDGPVAVEAVAAALALYAVGVVLQLYRWYVLVRALELPTTVRDTARFGLVGTYYNTFFPGAVGGDLLKAYFIAHAHPERKTRAVASVVADRVMGLYGLILFAALAGSVAWALDDPRLTGNPDLQRIVELTAAGSAVGAAAFLLLGALPQGRVDRFAARLAGVPKLGGALSELWQAVWMYRQRLRAVAMGLGLSGVAHFALVMAFHSASRVFPPADPGDLATLSEQLVIAPIGFILQAVPLSPGGVGVGEAIFAWLYGLSGRPAERGVTARLALRVIEWLIALIGYVIYLRMRAEVREIQHEVEEDETKDDETKDEKEEDLTAVQ